MKIILKKVKINLNLLKELRNKKKLSLNKISSEIGYKTPAGYWLIEKGQRKISIEILYRLSKLYQLEIEDLLIIHD